MASAGDTENKLARSLADEINTAASHRSTPMLVGIDGRSGSGKTTIAAEAAGALDAAHIIADDFCAADVPDHFWQNMSVEERLERVIDWRRLRREALEPLLRGETARWHPFNFEGGLREDGTYGFSETWNECEPRPIILLDGAYSCRPELNALVGYKVLIATPTEVCHARLVDREPAEFLKAWHDRWDVVEEFYFSEVMPESSFDLTLASSQDDHSDR